MPFISNTPYRFPPCPPAPPRKHSPQQENDMPLAERQYLITPDLAAIIDCTNKRHPMSLALRPPEGGYMLVSVSNSPKSVTSPSDPSNIWNDCGHGKIIGAEEIVRYAPCKAIMVQSFGGAGELHTKG